MAERSPADEEPAERADGGFVRRRDERLRELDDEQRNEPEGVASEPAADDESTDDARVCWLDGEEATDVIGALSSETARSIVTTLQGEPHTASELAESVETTVQNVRHHLEQLQSAGLVETAGTRYSVKGREMTVYAATDERVVVAVGGASDEFLSSLRGLFGAIGVLAAASVVVQWAVTPSPQVTRVADSVAQPTTTVVPPGVVFFLGGLALLTVIALAARR